jgi:hypothetical protein
MTDEQDPAAIGRAVATEYVSAFTDRDMERSRDVLNYPSVRLASGRVMTWATRDDYEIRWDLLAEREGWHHSTLDDVQVIQAGSDKVHIAATFSRYHEDGERYATHQAFWVITNQDGHWGIQCRSSYAP